MKLPTHILPLDASPLGVTLWLVSLDVDVTARDLAMLSATERERAARFRFERDAQRYRASHAALRRILAHALGLADPAQIGYERHAHGKPQLASHPLHFNMSHSGDWALIGISATHAMGVDLEVQIAGRPMPDTADLALQQFTEAEYAAFLSIPIDQREAAFLRGWTRKEACLKAVGHGLLIEPRSFEAGIGPAHRTTTLASPQGLHQVEVISLAWPTQAAGRDATQAAVARLDQRATLRKAPGPKGCKE
ncbi:MAG: 4'-phosphopantetheinyl transferase superfamily protein [Burkholderiales bacterium]|nr:4'-phosphopantetheinyl transferase superfamily protein [Burkholderiales bacterium]